MKKIYASVLALLFCFCASAQLTVTATQGTTTATSYTTIKAVFDAINAGTHKGRVTVSMTGNTTETATAVLNASGTGASSYTQIQLNATSSATLVTSNIAGPTIHLNGADSVIISGAGFLHIVNTNPAGQVVSFTNDACKNRLVGLYLKGATAVYTGTAAAPTITSGVVHFGAGVTTGNDNNLIDDCDIDGGNAAICLLYSKGSSMPAGATTNEIYNSNNRIDHVSFHDFINPAIAGAVGMTLGNSTGWSIRNNAMYFTAPVSTAQQFLVVGYQALPATTVDAHIMVANKFGGAAYSGTGTTTLTGSGTNALGLIAFDFEVGGAAARCDSNYVQNVTLNYGSALGSYSNSGFGGYIGGFDGIQFFRGNTVSNINFKNTAGVCVFSGLHLTAQVLSSTSPIAPAFIVDGNTVTGVTLQNGGGGDAQLHGIRLETSSGNSLGATESNPYFGVDNNTISNLSAPYAGASTFIRGIGTANVQGTSSSAALLPILEAVGNKISAFTTMSTLSSYSSAAVVGIHFAGANLVYTDDTLKLYNNEISNLVAANTGDLGVVAAGISVTNGLYSIESNKIWDIQNSSSAVNGRAAVLGMALRGNFGTSTVSNNFITIGLAGGKANHFGMLQNVNAATSAWRIYHNSIYVGGTAGAGSNDSSAAFVRATENFATGVTTPVETRNNIFYNARTGGTGAHFAIVNANGNASGWAGGSYNLLYSVNPNTASLWGGTQQTAFVYGSNSGETGAASAAITFANTATGDLHLAGASLSDNNLTAGRFNLVLTDIDNDIRNNTTRRGADEPNCAPAITTQPQAVSVCVGSPASLTVGATGSGLTYQWFQNGNQVSGATSATLSYASVAYANAGNYHVAVTNACGTTQSTAVDLNVPVPTTITSQPHSDSVCAGVTASFFVMANGGSLTYQWKKDGVNIAGATSDFLSIPNTTAANAGNYTVVVTGQCGTPQTSVVAPLAIHTTPSITAQPQNVTVCAGQPASFTVAASGPGLVYQWYHNGILAFERAATLTIPAVTTGMSGVYYVTVANACTILHSSDVTLTVNTGGSCTVATPNLDADVTSISLQPTLVRNGSALLRIQGRRTMQVNFTIRDAAGMPVHTFARTVTPGINDIRVDLSKLPAGAYLLTGYTEKGRTEVIRLVKQ